MAITWSVQIDWDNDGSFATAGDDITSYVLGVRTRGGMQNARDMIASIGTAQIAVRNDARIFSPDYAAGTYYGKLLPGKPVRIQINDGSTRTIWRGFTKNFKPSSGKFRDRVAQIDCVDFLEKIQQHSLNMPLVENVTGDVLIKHVINYALGAPFAAGTVTFSGNPSDGDSVTVNGTAYIFKNTLTASANQVKIGTAKEDTAVNLAAAINRAETEGTNYSTGTVRVGIATAAVSGAVVTITSVLPGTAGNVYTLAKSGANISVSGVTFSGGADYPSSPAPSLQTGIETFDSAGDSWSPGTNALKAIEQVVQSEFGYFWQARDGTLIFKHRNWIFGQVAAAVALTTNSDIFPDGGLSADDIDNFVQIRVTPRATKSSGIVAKTDGPVQVPGNSGTSRWSGSLPAAGNTIVELPFVDSDTGQKMGVRSIVLPLVATTNFTANTERDFSGIDYTNAGVLSFSVVLNASNVQVSIKNSSSRALWVNLTIYGVGIIAYNAQTIAREDTTSQANFGKRALSVPIPLPVNMNYADQLANYLLGKYKDPAFRYVLLDAENQTHLAGTSLYSLEIGDMIKISDYQGGSSNVKYLIVGMDYSLAAGNANNVKFRLFRLDDQTYWILDDTTYSVLDSTTRLGI